MIRRFGILNTALTSSDIPFYGIPTPGIYGVDEPGVITEKFFPRNHAKPESAETTLDQAQGHVQKHDGRVAAAGGDSQSIPLTSHRSASVRSSSRRRCTHVEIPRLSGSLVLQ